MIRYTNFAVMRMLATAIACVLCATACQTVVSKDRAIQTEIVTDPPGARIQINGEYIGNAPVKHAFQQDAGGKVIGSYTILATSVNPNELPESGWLGANLRPIFYSKSWKEGCLTRESIFQKSKCSDKF